MDAAVAIPRDIANSKSILGGEPREGVGFRDVELKRRSEPSMIG